MTNVKAIRASDGESGDNKGNWTYRLGADWQVADFLRFRATYGTSFRAPALFELFLADQESAVEQRSLDPCIQWGLRLDSNEISQQFADNCAADGVPDNHSGAGIPGTIIQGGGLGVLEPESSTAWTASVILTPRFSFPPDTRFDLAVDFFNIEVEGEVAQLGPRNLIAECYSSAFYPDDPVCGLFGRVGDLDPSDPYWNAGNPSNIGFVNDSFINVNNQKNRGVDVTGRIVHDFPGDTTLSFQAQMTWQTADSRELFDGFLEDLNGDVGEPRWTGDFDIQLDSGPWNIFYGVDVVGASSNVRNFAEDQYPGTAFDDLTQDQIDDALCATFITYPDDVCFDLSVPATFYHNVSVTREFAENFRLTAGISNLFGTDPPRTSNIGGDEIQQTGLGVLYSQYDLLGRRGFVNLNIQY